MTSLEWYLTALWMGVSDQSLPTHCEVPENSALTSGWDMTIRIPFKSSLAIQLFSSRLQGDILNQVSVLRMLLILTSHEDKQKFYNDGLV